MSSQLPHQTVGEAPATSAQPILLAQVAALPLRRAEDGSWRVMLLTSRDTGRWVIPKGWPMRGMKDHKAAAREAREEAGLVGRIEKKPLGAYEYGKRRPDRVDSCRVVVFRLVVARQLKSFREKGQRQLHWFKLEEAASLVDEADLQAIIRGVGGLGARRA